MHILNRTIVFLFLILHFLPATSQKIPDKPSGWVNDYAGILNPQEAAQLNAKLGSYEDTTSTQIFVVTLNETEGAEISMLAAELGEKWGVGQKGKDNGVIVLVFPEERRVFIATGYGLDQYLTDAATKRIIEQEITPEFRNGNYYNGLNRGTNVIMDLLSGKFTADQYRKQDKGVKDEAPFAGLIFLFIIIWLIFRGGRRRGTTLGRRNLPLWILLGMLGSSNRSSRGSWGGFSSGSGGFGGFGGGGFGGGGGGHFGGGGAGGSW